MSLLHLNIGSNQDRRKNIRLALDQLANFFDKITVSSLFESPSEGFEGKNFYNVGVSSSLPSCYGQFHHERSSGTVQSFQFSCTYDTAISNFNGITMTTLGGPNIESGKFKLYGIS